MKILLVLFLWAATTSAFTPDRRIINGEPAIATQFPWMAAIYYQTAERSSFCGGSLIDSQWVLTAAHCALNVEKFTIYLGATSLIALDPHRRIIETEEYIIHEDYIPNELLHDVCLIKLPEPITYNNYIQPITLSPNYLTVGVPGVIAGWGKISDDSTSLSEDLRYITLITISNVHCRDFYGDIISYRIACAIGTAQNLCGGDNGGPLIEYAEDGTPMQVGIASFVSDAGCESAYPSGFTRTSVYLPWIRQVTGINL